jgi:hypothetical protein
MGGFERNGEESESHSLEFSRLLAALRNRRQEKVPPTNDPTATHYRRTEDPRTGEVLFIPIPPSTKTP